MDWEMLSDDLTSLCADAGFIFVTVHPFTNRDMLESVTQSTVISTTLIEVQQLQLLLLDPRMSSALDACTATCLREVAQGQQHDLAGPLHSIVIPASSDNSFSAWALQVGPPHLDKDVELAEVLVTELVKATSNTFLQLMCDSLVKTKKLKTAEYFKNQNHELHVAYFVFSLICSYQETLPPLFLLSDKLYLKFWSCWVMVWTQLLHVSMMKMYHERKRCPGFVEIIDMLQKYIQEGSVTSTWYKWAVYVADCIWNRCNQYHWHVPPVHGQILDTENAEQVATLVKWEEWFQQLVAGANGLHSTAASISSSYCSLRQCVTSLI